jgi:cyclase
MLRPRIIPFLLIHKGGLVKTKRFAEPKYVGDPLNAVRIFNEKLVDEIMVADMDATMNGSEPDMELIAKLAAVCRMPLCYVGGVKKAWQVEKIVSLGVEKVGISSAAIEKQEIISEAAQRVGSQSVVVVADYRRTLFGRKVVHTERGRVRTNWEVVDYARHIEQQGAGELVIQSIERDGTGKGYDLETIRQVAKAVTIPVVGCGGAGSVDDLVAVLNTADAAAAGSLFVFHGPYRAVLISYPSYKTMRSLLEGG